LAALIALKRLRNMSATKVLLETIQVARHLGRIGARPVQKAAGQAAQAGEELAVWAIKLQPVQDALGKDRTSSLLDSYFQAKEVIGESVASLSHQSWNSALQTSAGYATVAIRAAGGQGRVVGPFDEHWNALKVLKDLQAAEKERATSTGGGLHLTPKRFVHFMREAERKKRAARQRDPVEQYVERAMQTGHMTGVGPRVLEKKLYTDIARLICFAFDCALRDANGSNIWGHELQVKVVMDRYEHLHSHRVRSSVGVEQVEALVDRMLMSEDLQVSPLIAGMQRQLLVNCSVMMLHLIEDLTTTHRMSVWLLGHSLRCTLEPLPMEQLWEDEGTTPPQRFRVNSAAVDELVEALIAEPEVQLILVPDLVEAEIYRYTLHRMMCILQFVLSQLRICLFGSEVRLEFAVEDDASKAAADAAKAAAATSRDAPSAGTQQVHVRCEDLQRLMERIEDERKRVSHELQRRRRIETSPFRSSLDAPELHEDDNTNDHEFQNLAAQDRLSRSLAVHRTIPVPIHVAYRCVSDIAEYPKWMPLCTSSKVLSVDSKRKAISCEVGFGLETGTVLGNVGDAIRYQVALWPPEASGGLRSARVVADTPGGFAYGKRLVYDWRFTEVSDTETDIKLDLFFQARNLFFLPIWDSMQATVTGAMMHKFVERAAYLSERGVYDSPSVFEDKAVQMLPPAGREKGAK